MVVEGKSSPDIEFDLDDGSKTRLSGLRGRPEIGRAHV